MAEEPSLDWGLLGERLHIIRRRRGLTAQKLAQLAGTTRTTVSRLENNSKARVSFDVVVRLAKALHVSLDYLSGRKDEETVPEPAMAAVE